jgi:nicotinate-nucleotide--dimethylbenzimidazole phosphoribosyltransferase
MNTASRSVVSKIVAAIESPSEQWRTRARAHLDVLTKPPGSLGMLEDIAAQMVSIRQEDFA